MLVVGDVHHWNARAAQQGAQLGAQVVAQLGIKIAHRLIQQEQRWPPDQGPRQGYPLPLPARKLGGFALAQPFQLHQGQHLIQLTFDLGIVHPPQLQAEAEVALHAEVGKQGIALKHHRHLPLSRRQSRDGAPAQPDVAGADGIQAGDQPQRAAFAAAAGAKHRQDFAGSHRQAELIHQRVAAHPAAELTQLQALEATVIGDGAAHPLMAP